MLEQPLLRDLGLVLLTATFFVMVARLVKVPHIVAYILAGLTLGPLLGVVEVSETIHIIAEVGIILLLFIVGLELSLKKIKEVGGIALGAGLAQMTITGGIVALVAWIFGLSGGDILFLGVALTFSSTVVVVKLLAQLRALDSRHGRVAVGILLVQDLVVVIVLTFTAGLAGGQELRALEVARDLGLAFLGMGVLLGVSGLLAFRVFPRLFRWIARSQEALLVWSLAWCFILVLGSEWLELSVELGAFIAGVALAQLPYSHDLMRRVDPLMNFFVAVFFVTLGIQMQLGAALQVWPLVLVLVIFTLLAKPPLIAWLTRLMGEPPRIALRSGLTLGQTSEFSFILAALALSNGLIDESMLSIVGAIGLLTMGLSSVSVLRGDQLVDWFDRRGWVRFLTGACPEGTDLNPDQADESLNDHIIVVGMNALGRKMVKYLSERGERVLALDTDPEKLEDLPCPTLIGNAEYLSVLEEAKIRRARLLISALHIEDVNRLLAFRAYRQGIPSIIHVYDHSVEEALNALDVALLLDSREAGVDLMTVELSREGIFGS